MKKFISSSLIGILCIFVLVVYQLVRFTDHKLHVVVCDVGQGDGILIITPSQKHIVVDAGPDKKMLDCLARHVPFWQRTIDLAVLSHPHFDHFMGFLYLLESYTVKQFATEQLDNPVASFKAVIEKLQEKKIVQRQLFAGDTFRTSDGVVLQIVGPSKEYLMTTSPNGTIGESAEFASVIVNVRFGEFTMLLTGDSQKEGIHDALRYITSDIDILQSPHHGSATGLSAGILQALKPTLAVISVGSKNRYGHPTSVTLDLFKQHNIPVERTDKRGDIQVVSDGKEWEIKD